MIVYFFIVFDNFVVCFFIEDCCFVGIFVIFNDVIVIVYVDLFVVDNFFI